MTVSLQQDSCQPKEKRIKLSESDSTSEINTETQDSPSTDTTAPHLMSPRDFFVKILKSPKYIVAPMVDQSELSWRILCRRYGANVCFTPMFHAKMFSDPSNRGYYNEVWQTDKTDTPLIVQFCANDPQHFIAAAKLVEGMADAVDLNIGCPQHIARRGKYGAYLMDDWNLIHNILKSATEALSIPVTAKIRVYPTIEKTIEYAKMVESTGIKMLTVHGRLREQKGHKTGLCNWDAIKAVKAAVNIPVVANGGILYNEDIDRCLEHTNADAVMVAENNLYNPLIFTPIHKPIHDVAAEYLEICKSVPTKLSYIRAHLFKLFRPLLPTLVERRSDLAAAKSLEEFVTVVDGIKADIENGIPEPYPAFDPENVSVDNYGYKVIPKHYCQPMIRNKFDPKTSKSDEPLGRH